MNTIHLMHHAMYDRREIAAAASASDTERAAHNAKETIRRVAGNEHLQRFIAENFSLSGRTFRLALISEAERVSKESAAMQGQAAK